MKIKPTLILLFLSLIYTSIYGQSDSTSSAFLFTQPCVSMTITPALRDLPNTSAYADLDKTPVIHNNLRRQKYTNPDAFPHGNDPLWQKENGELITRDPIQNWAGNGSGAYPPDPSGAAGPDHYVQMINSEYIIYDKVGTILAGPNSLASIIGSDAGDPIVLYDRFADRWLLSGFGVGNQLAVAISTTADPLGTYYLYTFNLGSFPDYPKYGIWHDGYYVTSNTSGPDCYVFERDKMLVGDVTASMIAMDVPSLGTGAGTETGGFHSVMPAHADFSLPPADKKLNLFYFQDDAWTGISDDQIKIWEITTNWDVPALSDVTLIQTVLTAPFDSQFNASWNDIKQPGTSQRLDAVPGAFMYRAQYTEWGTHNTVMLNHTVDVDATNHGGIRWYELREIDGIWSIYQQSTYAPDADSRWMGSISMDYQGNIGLAYAVSGNATYPSLRYTGRYADDPLGTLTISEITAISGTSSQTGINRFGDYAHMSVDPTDNATFWYTGEYIAGGRKTRVFSFKLASEVENDLGITVLNTPIDGILTASETVDVTITNFGTAPQDGFPVSYQINGGTIVTETYTAGPLAGGGTDNFTFATTANMATDGIYSLKLWTGLGTDEFHLNDTLETSVSHYFANDIGVTSINAPVSGVGLSLENIEVTIQNFGVATQTDFPVSFSVDGGTSVTESVPGPLTSGSTLIYTFTATADFSGVGTYDIVAYTSLAGDGDLTNDTASTSIEHYSCDPVASCSYGDGFTNFTLGTINNNTGCSPGGYADYSDISTDLTRGTTHTVSMTSGWNPQYVSIWIDFNDNNYFEAEEQVVFGFASGFGGSTTFDLAEDAPIGEHLIRAKSSDESPNVEDPCSDMEYGETEDYKINIIPGPGDMAPIANFTADLILAPPTSTISFTDLSTSDPTMWTWTITPAVGWVYTGGTTASSQNPQVTFNDVGIYTVKLDAANDVGSDSETKTNYIKISTFDGIIENQPFGLELTQKDNNIYHFNLNGSTEPFTIEIHDVMGKLIYRTTVNSAAGKTPFTIDLSGQAAGYYLIHVSDSKNSKVQKLWVK